MNITEALSFIHKTVWLGSKPGLSRTNHLLSLMDNPHKKLKFVHVAGTNGKGSTCAMLSSILTQAGYKTGLYTSPYINVFNERMQIDGRMISDSELCSLCEYIKPLSDTMTEDPPTEFELITALAMEYYYENNCDIVVLEVGMGGELDSTNVIDSPEVAVITAIDLDHTSFLGNTIEKVAEAKSGIIKEKTTAVIYECSNTVKEVFTQKCKKIGAKACFCDKKRVKNVIFEQKKTTFDYKKYNNLAISLVGSYQPYNAALAIEVVEILRQKGYKITDDDLRTGLHNTSWPGRFEILGTAPVFVLDGAHNPHGMRATVDSLKTHFEGKKITFVVGAMADKDVSGMMGMLLPLADRFIAVKPNNPRAMEAEKLAELLVGLGGVAESETDVEKAIKKALSHAGKDGIVACLGSLYFSGEIREAYYKITGEKS